MNSPTMQRNIKDVKQTRVKLVMDARKIIDQAEAESRAMSAEEKSAWDEMMKEVDDLGERLTALEKQADAEDESDEDEDEDEDEDRDSDDEATEEDDEDDEDEDDDEDDEDRKRSAFKRFIIRGGKKYILQKRSRHRRGSPRRGSPRRLLSAARMPGESARDFETRKRRSSKEYRDVFSRFILEGDKALSSTLARRAIQADSDIVGGYLVAPQEFVASLIKFVNNYVFLRKKATVYQVLQAQSLGAPSLDADPEDAVWASELDSGNEDYAMSFGKRELVPHPMAGRLRVSNRLLRMANIASVVSADGSGVSGSAEALVRDRLAYKFAVSEEKAFLLGTGGNQPLGLFTASTNGIDISRDVTTGTAGQLKGDDLIAAKYNQKIQYWPRMQWLFHRNVLQSIRQLKDSYGQYLWVPGGFGGESDRLLDIPVNMSEYAPSALTSGAYAGILGDMSFYWIVDSLTFELQRLVELYAAANQVGFIARMEVDGMPVLPEAFTRLKIQ